MSLSLDEIRKVASTVNADRIVMGLSDSYESNVRSSGNNLSGGERRRLAILRALLRRPGLLVLDEPTAGLDGENAKIVWEAIENIGSEVTRVVSTHRMEEAKKADLIIVLQDGKLVESGCHHDLFVIDGVYARMIKQQFGFN
jgi:ATP-binding cassette subfamily B protein